MYRQGGGTGVPISVFTRNVAEEESIEERLTKDTRPSTKKKKEIPYTKTSMKNTHQTIGGGDRKVQKRGFFK